MEAGMKKPTVVWGVDVVERFWAKVEMSDGCWGWTAYKDSCGYGRMGVGNRSLMRAHRLSWEIHFGPIPDGMIVRHSCDNPSCTNPRHLLLGTHQDNANDRVERRRGAVGKAIHTTKLSPEDVAEIRNALGGGATLREVGAEFGIDHKTVHNIKTGKTWRWL